VQTTTLRGANRGGDSPHWHRLCAPAQVVWSRCPSLASRRRVVVRFNRSADVSVDRR